MIRESPTKSYFKSFTSQYKNNQIMLWICHNGATNLSKMRISNYNANVQHTFSPPVNFTTKILKISYIGYLKKIGLVERFIDINSLEYHRIILEELRNGSYFTYIFYINNICHLVNTKNTISMIMLIKKERHTLKQKSII